MQNFISCFILAWLVLSPFPLGAYEDSQTPPFFQGERFRLKMNTSYYYTEDNFIGLFQSESLRQSLQLKGGLSPFFHFMRTGLSLGYSPFSYLSLEAFLEGFWFAQSGNGTQLYFSSPEVKRVGGIVTSHHLIKGVFGFIPRISFSYPFFSINYNTQTPITDDGVWQMTPSLWLYGVLFDVVVPFVQGGFKWRGQPLSSFFQWKAGLMLRADIAEIGLDIHGFWSITLDPSSKDLGDRVQLLKRVNAGSMRFFSANPSGIGGTGWLAWHFPFLTLRFSGDMDWAGARYSKGYGVLAEVIIKIGKIHKTRVESLFEGQKAIFEPNRAKDSALLEQSFNQNQEKVNRFDEEDIDSLFNESEHTEEQKIQDHQIENLEDFERN